MKENQKSAIVIGSGFGGLAIAIRLQSAGYNTTIIEKNEMPGGHASQLIKDGYVFDLGPSIITAPDVIKDLFNTAGEKFEDYLELIPLDPFYRIYFHDKTLFDYSDNEEKMKQQLSSFSGKDKEGYDKFMQYASKLYKDVITEKLGSKPFDSFKTLVSFLPEAIRLNIFVSCFKMASKFFLSENARFIFSFHALFIGGNPFRDPSLFLMIPYLEKRDGVWFTKGGMYSLVKALVKVFEKKGGKIILNTEVKEIMIEDGKAVGVVTNDGEIRSDLVISNAHFAHTYKDLINSKYRKKWTDKKIVSKDYSMSAFLIYLGVKKKYDSLEHHTLILSKRYKELIEDIFDNKILADDFSMYLHRPSATDPSMAPDGCDSLYLLIPVPNKSSGINWEEEKEKYAKKILDYLEYDFGLVDLHNQIEVCEIFTPDDFENKRNNYLGAAWSLEPKFNQVASFRPHNKSEEFKNLYLVGASTHPGGGVPGVLLSAEATMQSIIEDHNE